MFLKEEVKSYRYTDAPDGEDIIPKFLCLVKPAAITSFAVSTIDVALYSHPKGYFQALGRYVHFTWPIMGATAAFVVTHNMAAAYRKKDDKFNWFLGGASVGGVWGIWRKTVYGGVVLGVALGVFATVQKFCLQNGYELMPSPRPQTGGIWSSRMDWTLMKHRPGNWTTGKEE